MHDVWIGKTYKGGGIFGKRVFIVGESTYHRVSEDVSSFNVLMAEDHMAGYTDRFRTKLVRAFLGHDREGLSDIQAFWHSVAFANFVSRNLGAPRVAPLDADWADGVGLTKRRLASLQPALVVCLGYRMFDEWIRRGLIAPTMRMTVKGAGRPDLYMLRDSATAPETLVYGMKHPSSSFSWRREHPFLQSAIRLAPG